MRDVGRGWRVPFAIVLLSATWARTASAQVPIVLECTRTATTLISKPVFDPPVRGPLTYEWRDSNGRIVGAEAGLAITLPVGKHTFTLNVTAETGVTARNQLTVLVQDTMKPTFDGVLKLLEGPPDGVGVDLARAAGFTFTDVCDPRPSVTASPAGPYPPGETDVLLTATDASGNSASVTVAMRVPLPAGRPDVASPSPSASPGPPVRRMPAARAPPNVPSESPVPAQPFQTGLDVPPPGPPATLAALTLRVTSSRVVAGEPVSFAVSIEGAAALPPYVFDAGDGSASETRADATFTHVYQSAGAFAASVSFPVGVAGQGATLAVDVAPGTPWTWLIALIVLIACAGAIAVRRLRRKGQAGIVTTLHPEPDFTPRFEPAKPRGISVEVHAVPNGASLQFTSPVPISRGE